MYLSQISEAHRPTPIHKTSVKKLRFPSWPSWSHSCLHCYPQRDQNLKPCHSWSSTRFLPCAQSNCAENSKHSTWGGFLTMVTPQEILWNPLPFLHSHYSPPTLRPPAFDPPSEPVPQSPSLCSWSAPTGVILGKTMDQLSHLPNTHNTF